MLTVTKLTGSPGDILAYAQGRKDRSARGDYYLDRDGRDHELARVTRSPVMAGSMAESNRPSSKRSCPAVTPGRATRW
jgi:hypothetical protein